MQLRGPVVSVCETVQQVLLQLANLAATKISFILSCFSCLVCLCLVVCVLAELCLVLMLENRQHNFKWGDSIVWLQKIQACLEVGACFPEKF